LRLLGKKGSYAPLITAIISVVAFILTSAVLYNKVGLFHSLVTYSNNRLMSIQLANKVLSSADCLAYEENTIYYNELTGEFEEHNRVYPYVIDMRKLSLLESSVLDDSKEFALPCFNFLYDASFEGLSKEGQSYAKGEAYFSKPECRLNDIKRTNPDQEDSYVEEVFDVEESERANTIRTSMKINAAIKDLVSGWTFTFTSGECELSDCTPYTTTLPVLLKYESGVEHDALFTLTLYFGTDVNFIPTT